jgi:hypothetical protein
LTATLAIALVDLDRPCCGLGADLRDIPTVFTDVRVVGEYLQGRRFRDARRARNDRQEASERDRPSLADGAS